MELSEVIKYRRSIRRFKPDPVPRDVMDNLLELAQGAPSDMNGQEDFGQVLYLNIRIEIGDLEL
jgi:nitroreductase